MGLLDYNPQEQFMTQGLLGMGSALLTPVSRGGGFAAVGPALMSAQANAMQMAEAQRQAKLAERKLAFEEKMQPLQLALTQAHVNAATTDADLRKQERDRLERIRTRLMGGEATPQTPGADAVQSAFPLTGGFQATGTLPQGPQTPGFPQISPRRAQYDRLMRQADIYEQEGDIANATKLREVAVKTMPEVSSRDLMTRPDGKTVYRVGYKDGTFEDQEGTAPMDPNKPFNVVGGRAVPNAPYQAYEIGKAREGAPRTTVTNINAQESEQSKVYGKNLGEMRSGIAQAAFTAPSKLAQLDRMEQLLSNVDGGKFAPAGKEVASALNSIGIKIDPNLGNKEAAEALSREIAGNMRQPGTGTMTDKDFEEFLKRVPDLSKSKEGRQQIFTTMRAALKRDIEVDKMARAYAKQNRGVIDDNFFDQVADFYAKNPVVPQVKSNDGWGIKRKGQ